VREITMIQARVERYAIGKVVDHLAKTGTIFSVKTIENGKAFHINFEGVLDPTIDAVSFNVNSLYTLQDMNLLNGWAIG